MNHDEALHAVHASLIRIVPDADLSALAPDEDVRDALELDSLDFLAFVETLAQRAAIRLDEDDYPVLRTTEGAATLVAARTAGQATA